jgi:thiol-disulfide isomerase/thioredoxin
MGGALAAGLMPVATGAIASPKIGKPAPKFAVTTFDRQRISSADLLGNVVILNYWATWCGPCRAELPLISGWVKSYQDKFKRNDLKVFAITTEDSVPDDLLIPLSKVLSFPLATKIDTWSYGPIEGAVPSNYVIDRDGILRYGKAASFTLEALNALLPPLLSESATGKIG